MKTLGCIFLIPCLTYAGPCKGQEEAGTYSLVISEIMADPHPAIGLPDAEYIEVFNRGTHPVPLAGYRLLFGSKKRILPKITDNSHPGGWVINPGEYIVICDEKDAPLFKSKGNILPLSQFPAILNTGATLVLQSPSGRVIHSVSFSDRWYRSAEKADGGWSLEMIDPDNPCGYSGNWCESRDPSGGTPGYINSANAINRDIEKPVLLRATLNPDRSVRLYFSEDMDSSTLMDPFRYYGTRDLLHPVWADPVEPNFAAVDLFFKNNLYGTLTYTVTVLNSLKDCAGNSLKNNARADFAIPQPADSLDVVINELLFDTPPGMSEFIELYNRSAKVIDLAGFSLASCNRMTDSVVKSISLKETSFLLFPGQYVVFTRRSEGLPAGKNKPDPSNVMEQPSLFALPDKEGQITLFDAKKNVIDRFTYNRSMHSLFLRDDEGISLERISANLPTNEPENWFSAAFDEGFSTPGYQNSQDMSERAGMERISVSPALFSPDGDGCDDETYVTLLPGAPGFICNVEIYDLQGRKVRTLCSGMLSGTETRVTWDGTCNNSQDAPIGIYLICIEMYNQQGIVNKYRKVVALARKLVKIN